MLDRYGRRINYLRVSVTDRCNLRCVYCSPVENFSYIPHEEIVSFEEICQVVRAAVELGVDKVRVTGGEPLVRKDINVLVNLLSRIEGIRDLSMTTNGLLLKRFAGRLKRGGLHRVNISLDTMDPKRYSKITGGGDLRRVLLGIEAARSAGLAPIRLNCVVRESSDEPDARAVAEFARQNGYEARFIRQMNMATGEFWVVDGGSGGDCSRCNRLRVSANGMVHPCLFSNLTFSIREHGPKGALLKAVDAKPRSGASNDSYGFLNMGG